MTLSHKTVLILGVGGMLGNALFRYFFSESNFTVFGTLQTSNKKNFFTASEHNQIIVGVNVESDRDLIQVLLAVKPDVVINCIGIIKQSERFESHLENISINAALPHRILNYCQLVGGRLIHLSTDCVFSGKKGLYKETDFPDANDLYGRTKYLGEVKSSDSVTIRTSIIGHEIATQKSLIDWFLNQEGFVKGFKNAIFSGFPTIEIARIVRDFIIPNTNLSGLYHLSSDPISKFELLSIVAKKYGKKIDIIADNTIRINRSLNSDRFRRDANFVPSSWPDLIQIMYQDFVNLSQRRI